MVGQAQRLHQSHRVARLPSLRHHGQDRGITAGVIVLFGGQPDPQSQRQERLRVHHRQGAPLTRAHHGGVRDRAVLVHPQPTEAQRRARQPTRIPSALRFVVGRLEPLPADSQAAIDEQCVLPFQERVLDVVLSHGRAHFQPLRPSHSPPLAAAGTTAFPKRCKPRGLSGPRSPSPALHHLCVRPQNSSPTLGAVDCASLDYRLWTNRNCSCGCFDVSPPPPART